MVVDKIVKTRQKGNNYFQKYQTYYFTTTEVFNYTKIVRNNLCLKVSQS